MLKDAICATAVTALFALMVPAQADEMQRSKVDVRQDAKAVSADWAGYAGYFADQDGSVTLARDNADWRSYSGYFANSYGPLSRDVQVKRKDISADWRSYAGYFADSAGRAD